MASVECRWLVPVAKGQAMTDATPTRDYSHEVYRRQGGTASYEEWLAKDRERKVAPNHDHRPPPSPLASVRHGRRFVNRQPTPERSQR